ncbi:MFS transporter, partial [Neisseria gonorrhoeae]
MTTITSDTRPEPDSVSTWLTFLLALSCGLVVANIYYAQPLAGPIATELGLQPEHAGLLVTMTQLGYGAGLLLIVPLGDLIENRRLVTTTIA